MPMGIKEDPTTRKYVYPPAHQADATLAQVNPVSAQLYTILATTANVRIYSVSVNCVWTVQPNPIEVVITIDGQTIVYAQANPATGTNYALSRGVTAESAAAANQLLINAYSAPQPTGFQLEGRSVLIQARVTGGTVSQLNGRAKYAVY